MSRPRRAQPPRGCLAAARTVKIGAMDRDDADDPTRALDGFAAALRAAAPKNDPTTLLDRWSVHGPAPATPPGPSDGDRPDRAPRPASGRPSVRLTLLDVTDVEVVDTPAPTAAVVEAADWQPGSFAEVARPKAIDGDWQPGRLVEQAPRVAGVTEQWKPGVWIGAVRRVCGPLAEFVQSPNGPVVETFPPHVLVALWPPQTLSAPFLGRWPLHAALHAVEADQVGVTLMQQVPAGGQLWLVPPAQELAIDWALLADLVLHHDAGLRDFQIRELRSFLQAQRDAGYAHLNDAYEWPAPGRPVTRR
jgi:hypothetical protein